MDVSLSVSFFFFIEELSSVLPMVQEKYCDTTEKILGTKNKDKRSEKETKEDVQAGSWSNGVMS